MTITLVIRLSSLGDVAILIPTLYSVASKNPDDIFLLITKKPLQPLFFNKPDNLIIFPMQSKERHKGFWGLIRAIGDIDAVVNQLRKKDLTGRNSKQILKVADLHAVIRSAIIDFFFRLKGAKVAVIAKSRLAGRALVRRENKIFQPLQTAFGRYREVFEKLSYDASLNFKGFYPKEDKKTETWIGVAPFAKHRSKIYPFEQMEEVVRILNNRPATKIFLFGGKEECRLLEEWTRKYGRVESVAGSMPFPDELSLMNRLDVMLSMDSANMHLASLVNTPVVSVWGATHPYAGFYSYNQNPKNAVQIDLSCRPCSIFGGKPCWRGDYACLTGIDPQVIVEKINSLLSLPQITSETPQS
ncbi:MAG: glycosyltransferase family 9 protein [Candidatus Symbiothrix sp.]|jgi:ADP-heptose:LPS heptosyltransferase|nr:glycosyltransferase family 9 protein [Candidatus Symbiothrix sp.]